MKNHSRYVVPVACFATLLALVGCRRSERAEQERSGATDRSGAGGQAPSERSTATPETTGQTTVTGAQMGPVSHDSAVERIVMARCEREATCNNVGANKRYADRPTCARELRTKMHDDLKTSDCPQGVDGKQLDECLKSIRDESCNNPVETLSRLSACRSSELCPKGANR